MGRKGESISTLFTLVLLSRLVMAIQFVSFEILQGMRSKITFITFERFGDSVNIMVILDVVSQTTFRKHFVALGTRHFTFFVNFFDMSFELGSVRANQVTD